MTEPPLDATISAAARRTTVGTCWDVGQPSALVPLCCVRALWPEMIVISECGERSGLGRGLSCCLPVCGADRGDVVGVVLDQCRVGLDVQLVLGVLLRVSREVVRASEEALISDEDLLCMKPCGLVGSYGVDLFATRFDLTLVHAARAAALRYS